MTWISLVCLLALSGAVFGRSVPLDGYGGSTRIVQSGYGQELPAPEVRIASGYGSQSRVLPSPNYGGYGSSSNNRVLDGDMVIDTLPPTQADILCRGQLAQTVIPIEGNTKFVVCIDEGKGTVQDCPPRLLFNEQTRRCEHVQGPRDDFCLSQPCRNGAQCLSLESTFQCQCAPGWEGMFCELDASFCQNNRPCGSDPRVKCQSFLPGAALQWICVADDGTYGPDGQHVHRSICQDSNGPHALDFTDKGFYTCHGSRPHYESCTRLTKWDNLNKACAWPEVVVDTRSFVKSGYGDSYSSQPAETRVLSSYGGETRRLSSYGGDLTPMPETRTISSYGSVPETRTFSSYGSAPITKSFSSYGSVPETKVFSSYGAPEVKVLSSYGGDLTPMAETRTISSYGSSVPETKVFSSYGGHETKSFSSYGAPETKVISSYGGDLTPMPETRTISSSYGSVPETRVISSSYGSAPITKTFSSYGSAPITKSFSSYGSAPITKSFSSYGSSRLIAPQLKVAQSYGGY